MKIKFIIIFWGIVCLLAGISLLAGFDWAQLSRQSQMAVFAIFGAGFFVTYYLHGARNWGWLFPAMFCTATAFSIGMEITGWKYSDPITNLLYGASLTVPFYTGYAVNRKHWGLLVTANIIVAFGAVIAALPYVNGQINAALVFYATGLPFLVLYLMDRSRRWAIVTTAIIAAAGTMPLLSSMIKVDVNGDLFGAAFLFLVALVFFALYFWSKENWWAIIPGGIMASFGASVLVEILVPHHHQPSVVVQGKLLWDPLIWFLFLCFAATFAVLWLMRKTHPTGWAIYPAAGWLALAILSFIEGPRFADYWLALTLLVTGTVLLAALIVKMRLMVSPQAPHLKGGRS
jgi:hypothetical protein